MKPDKIYLSLSFLILITVFSWFTSCSHVADIANLPEVCFTGDILPIFIIIVPFQVAMTEQEEDHVQPLITMQILSVILHQAILMPAQPTRQLFRMGKQDATQAASINR